MEGRSYIWPKTKLLPFTQVLWCVGCRFISKQKWIYWAFMDRWKRWRMERGQISMANHFKKGKEATKIIITMEMICLWRVILSELNFVHFLSIFNLIPCQVWSWIRKIGGWYWDTERTSLKEPAIRIIWWTEHREKSWIRSKVLNNSY